MSIEDDILANTEEILRIIKNEWNITDDDDVADDESLTNYQEEIKNLLKTGTYEDIVEYMITTLSNEGIYSEDDIFIKVFTDPVGNTILEVKLRPFREWGKTIDWFYTNLGEPEQMETSRYTMRIILWYDLTRYVQQKSDEEDAIIDVKII